jgi:internalin A
MNKQGFSLVYLALFAGLAAGPLLLTSQRASAGAQQIQRLCMWNEAVCKNGNAVSIGIVATDSDMVKLDGLHGVKELAFMVGPDRTGAPKISDTGFAHIQNLPELESLYAVDLPLLTDDALRSLSELTHLKEARFESNRNFSDAGLAHLQNLARLKTVTFYGAPITDRGIHYLRKSTDLQDLQLGQSLVTDEGASEIAEQFRNLKMLDLQGTKITNIGVVAIATLPDLEWLCLKNTAVRDQGVLALRAVPSLRDLYLTPGTVHDESVASLEHALPELRVHFQ